MPQSFNSIKIDLEGSDLREPQRLGFMRIKEHYAASGAEREVGIVLPVGCGKSGLIAIAPFAVASRRALVVAPYVKIAKQLHQDFDPSSDGCFYVKTGFVVGQEFPEPVEIRGRTTNRGDLDEADVVITNIDQLQGDGNRWLSDLPGDYFDCIIFDEGHHATAASWSTLKRAFPEARVINLSATPRRADGDLMPGRIIYSYAVRAAIENGYVKRVKALVLNPATLRFVRDEDGQEVEVSLEEVCRLGEEDADFRRSILTSAESLSTIVDASIREMRRIRAASADQRHKIIASALNYKHCHQIVEAFRARGLRAAFVHSREEARANDRVLEQLEAHELDVIVQVRKLNEGFDHPYLSVAAVCSVFRELSPFVQFVGRIMRAIAKGDPASPLNQGTVVFHAGSNIARRWSDFREFSEADQQYFDDLLPMEGLDFSNREEILLDPTPCAANAIEVKAQTGVQVSEVPLLEEDASGMEAIRTLQERGYTLEDLGRHFTHEPIQMTKVRQRQAARKALDDLVRLTAGAMLNERGLNQEGAELDTKRLGRSNFVVVKARIDALIREYVGDKERSDYTQADLNVASAAIPAIREQVAQELFNGRS